MDISDTVYGAQHNKILSFQYEILYEICHSFIVYNPLICILFNTYMWILHTQYNSVWTVCASHPSGSVCLHSISQCGVAGTASEALAKSYSLVWGLNLWSVECLVNTDSQAQPSVCDLETQRGSLRN